MPEYFKQIDWKTVAFSLLGCYILPTLFFGTVILAALNDETSESGQIVAGILVFSYFIVVPLSAGYFTARYAARLPQFHVAIVAIIGFLIVWATTNSTFIMYLVHGTVSLAVTALGAFLRLRSAK